MLRKSLRDKEPTVSSIIGLEEALAQLSMEFMNPTTEDKLFTITDITPQEIFGISTLMSLAETFNSELMRNWVNNFLRLRISRFRMGRKELLMLGSGIKETGERRKRASLDSLFSGFK